MIEKIIPPEIYNDQLYFMLEHFSTNPILRNFLEIGSSSGGGSTQAFVSGIKRRTDKSEVKLFCMEISHARFEALCAQFEFDSFVKPYKCSSISLGEFPEWDEVQSFYEKTNTALNGWPLDQIQSWYDQDIKYLLTHQMTFNGINKIKTDQNIKNFDMVLIDGSEFSGERDLHHVMGSKVIVLDDINSFKCYNAFQTLLHHSSYRLVNQALYIRSGFAVFERVY